MNGTGPVGHSIPTGLQTLLHFLELSVRDICIDTNDKSYITVQDIDTWYGETFNVDITGNATTIVFDNVDSNYSHLAGYHITGDGSANSVLNVTIQNGTVTGNDHLAEETPIGAFIYMDGTTGFGVDGITIQNMTITGGSDNTSKHGIGIFGWQTNANVTIKNNTISNLWGHGIDVTNGISGTFTVSGTNLIESNTISKVGYGYTQSYGGIGIGTDDLTNRPHSGATVRYNTMDDIGGGGIYVWPTTSSLLYYNKISNIGKWAAASTVYPCGIVAIGPAHGALGIYNNTIYPGPSPATNNSTVGIQLATGATGATINNNLIYGSSLYSIWSQADYTGLLQLILCPWIRKL